MLNLELNSEHFISSAIISVCVWGGMGTHLITFSPDDCFPALMNLEPLSVSN